MSDEHHHCGPQCRVIAERLVDAQQTIVEAVQETGLPPNQATIALLCVAMSCARLAGRSHDDLVRLLDNMRSLAGKGTEYGAMPDIDVVKSREGSRG